MWADQYIAKLTAGETVGFRPRGGSMVPLIRSGQLCTVAPVVLGDLSVGDIVLCKVKGTQYLHLVKAVADGRVLIGINRNGINGWTAAVYGRLVSVQP